MSKKRTIYLCIIIVLVIVFLISLFNVIKPFVEKNPAAPIPKANSALANDEGASSVSETLRAPIELPVDFKELWKTNTDVYAWINIPGTNVDYPILQSEDNTYYLNHTWDKKEYKAGSIYTETYNSKEFDDPNTIIYGHRMYAGDMFAALQNFSEADFFDTNRYFYIYTPKKILTYEIIASVPFGEEHLLFAYNFSNPEDMQEFYDDVFSTVDFRACMLENPVLDPKNDKIVTLSTCLKGNSNKRYLVIGKLIKVEE